MSEAIQVPGVLLERLYEELTELVDLARPVLPWLRTAKDQGRGGNASQSFELALFVEALDRFVEQVVGDEE